MGASVVAHTTSCAYLEFEHLDVLVHVGKDAMLDGLRQFLGLDCLLFLLGQLVAHEVIVALKYLLHTPLVTAGAGINASLRCRCERGLHAGSHLGEDFVPAAHDIRQVQLLDLFLPLLLGGGKSRQGGAFVFGLAPLGVSGPVQDGSQSAAVDAGRVLFVDQVIDSLSASSYLICEHACAQIRSLQLG